jgi:pSer/pThr/pTyr-binding forkhead associated (FHA) protein
VVNMTDFALRFISGKYQGGQFKLKMNREIIIGRATDGDMVLVEDMVSRRHSKITTFDDKITIIDFGSTNGTFVNGERVNSDPVELKEGDRVLIGTSVLKLVVDEDSQNEIAQSEGMSGVSDRRTTMSITRHMSGSIDEIPLPDLLQLLSTSRKSGVMNIFSEAKESKIYLRDGKVYYCSINNSFDLDPTKAFFRLLTWVTGTFDLLAPDDAEFLNEITDSTEALLMEGMRIIDEMSRIKNEIPDPDVYFTLANPIDKPFKELNPQQLDVFQLIHNVGTVQVILDRSPISDLDTYEILLLLENDGYIVRMK